MHTSTLSDRLGGPAVLGRDLLSDFDWVEALENGLPPAVVDASIERGLLSRAESDILVIPRRTLQHRKERNQRLSPEESDKLFRIARISAQAERAFSNPEKAARWMRKPSRPLHGAIPLDLLKTSAGTELVQEELVRIEHGINL